MIDTADLLEKRGIGLRSLTEAIDTTPAGGRLVFHAFGAMAEFERSIIRERTKAGLDAARAKGRTGGRPLLYPPQTWRPPRRFLTGPDKAKTAAARALDQ